MTFILIFWTDITIEETINKIYKEYLTWLNENCTTFAQDASSGEFTGIAIDWQGKEEEQPDFGQYLWREMTFQPQMLIFVIFW